MVTTMNEGTTPVKIRTAVPLLFGAACLGVAGLLATAVATMPDAANPATPTPTSAGTVKVPAAFNATCTKDVSHGITTWFENLPSGTTVKAAPTACYLISKGMRLSNVQRLTISGGTWKDASVPRKNAPPKDSPKPIFWFVGGDEITLTGMTIAGAHSGGYDPSGAFEAAIRSDGVRNLDVQHDTIENPYGDGIELNVLRGAQDDSGQILNPTVGAWIQYDTITGAGRQGITMSGVRGAYVGPSVALKDIGINDFDLEADQTNEGAKNVTVNGCTTKGTGASFFANGGAGSGAATSNVTVENCTMKNKQGGDPILVQNIANSGTRGPFTFEHDTIRCGASTLVGCIQLTGANVTVAGSRVISPDGTVLPVQYKVKLGSSLALTGSTFVGFFKPGVADKTSTVTP